MAPGELEIAEAPAQEIVRVRLDRAGYSGIIVPKYTYMAGRRMRHFLGFSEAVSLALHAAVLLAANGDALVSTKQIASKLGVSEAHLSKVLQRLARMGFVTSVRGPKGGFRLGKSARRITLLQLYQAIEGPLPRQDCLFDKPICDGKGCILGEVLRTVNKNVEKHLATTTVSQLADVFARQECKK